MSQVVIISRTCMSFVAQGMGSKRKINFQMLSDLQETPSAADLIGCAGPHDLSTVRMRCARQ